MHDAQPDAVKRDQLGLVLIVETTLLTLAVPAELAHGNDGQQDNAMLACGARTLTIISATNYSGYCRANFDDLLGWGKSRGHSILLGVPENGTRVVFLRGVIVGKFDCGVKIDHDWN